MAADKVLYGGLDLPAAWQGRPEVVHFPLIEVVACDPHQGEIRSVVEQLPHCTHCIFTSKNAVRFLLPLLELYGMPLAVVQSKPCYAVGAATAAFLERAGWSAIEVAALETAEGVIDRMKLFHQPQHSYFWPHSILARSVIADFLCQQGAVLHACPLYTSCPTHRRPLPDLQAFKTVVLTSPSTVEAFFKLFPQRPSHLHIETIGPITAAAFETLSKF